MLLTLNPKYIVGPYFAGFEACGAMKKWLMLSVRISGIMGAC